MPKNGKTFYDIVEANNERLLQLINEILDLSKIEAGIVEFTITPVRLHSLCREIYDALKFRCPQGGETHLRAFGRRDNHRRRQEPHLPGDIQPYRKRL